MPNDYIKRRRSLLVRMVWKAQDKLESRIARRAQCRGVVLDDGLQYVKVVGRA